MERLLDSVDAVVYLLDYTKLKTVEEAAILRKFKEINPQLMQRLSQRLFFVVSTQPECDLCRLPSLEHQWMRSLPKLFCTVVTASQQQSEHITLLLV